MHVNQSSILEIIEDNLENHISDDINFLLFGAFALIVLFYTALNIFLYLAENEWIHFPIPMGLGV